jgi:UDPglucose 6-dehydrogenase
MKNICIIGTGRVGLTLALTLASAGFRVSGIEKNKDVVESLKRGTPHFYEKGLDALLKKHLNKNFGFASINLPPGISCAQCPSSIILTNSWGKLISR